MLAYPLLEAEVLLESKLASATINLTNCEEDLDFLREQITVRTSQRLLRRHADSSLQTLEVATARVYNWDVMQKRKEKADHPEGDDDDKGIPNG